MESQSQGELTIGAGGELAHTCTITRHDLEILLMGSETEKEKGYRNLCAGIAISSGLGSLASGTTHFKALFSVGLGPFESICLILLLAITLASTALTLFFYQRVRHADVSGDLRVLNNHIRTQLHRPQLVEDPGYWP